ncbi:hypothetical protein SOASR030_30660 [Leminorella grimontii]|uniref:Uncharacterized protein n=1 Tax=Leminorella grimontii TaxID=82981 RepID=A0AAV5N7L1_9GAMM|nr:hypothetical protein [Leminorella grimontii]KFC97202.1 hypothetical protein GLGR_0740 [Leminorella grimontii ATCC 33999 = DSM 5078]GKX56954.1 hypothetical protein SOASR030_30660 [Leminorella grimontii]GKX58927.1 hypothetical protein SOASR031_12420 [Leminorella grimontii]VFS57428.1 Uncharacterised protein [Leminorella grimontii]
MAIVIEEPVKIVLNEIEIDDRIPSVNFDLYIGVNHLMYSTEYKGNIWIPNRELGNFISSFKNNDAEFSLSDTFGNAFITLKRVDDSGYQFCMTKSRKTLNHSKFEISYSEHISMDVFYNIKAKFLDCPVIW